MSDGDIVPDGQGKGLPGDVQDAKVLDIGSGTDPDPVDVSPDDGGKPDAGFRSDHNISDHLGGIRDPDGRIDLRKMSLVGKDHVLPFQRTRFHFLKMTTVQNDRKP